MSKTTYDDMVKGGVPYMSLRDSFPEKDPNATYNILGIDPGSITIGFSCMTVRILDNVIVNTESFTENLTKRTGLRQVDEGLALSHGELFMRMQQLRHVLLRILNYYQPVGIACEAPFFSMSSPSAFEPLVTTIATIKQTVYEWSATSPVRMVETTVAKKSISPKSEPLKSMSKAIKDTKSRVRFNAENCAELKYLNVNNLDEHSLDAGIVNHVQYLSSVLGLKI